MKLLIIIVILLLIGCGGPPPSEHQFSVQICMDTQSDQWQKQNTIEARNKAYYQAKKNCNDEVYEQERKRRQ